MTFTGKGKGKVYVGNYEARATPVADLDKKTTLEEQDAVHPGQLPDALRLAEDRLQAVHPQGDSGKKGGKGKFRIARGSRRSKNFAAAAARRQGDRARPPARATPSFLIDGTEATNWGGVTAGNVDATHPSSRSTWPASARCGSTGSRSARCSTRLRPSPRSCRSRRTPTPGRGSPRCASSPSRCASRPAPRPRRSGGGSTPPGRRVPGDRAAPGRART